MFLRQLTNASVGNQIKLW